LKGNFGHPLAYKDKPVAKYVEYFRILGESLPKGLSYIDLFGGIGALPKAMWDTVEPKSWVSIEIDPALEEHFLEPRARFIQGDAFTDYIDSDVIVIDPHKCTLNAIWKDPKWASLFTRIVQSSARYILMQEYGAYWCHLPNQVPLYETLSQGRRVNRVSYPYLFADKMADWYDLKVLRHLQGMGSTYYLMEIKK
jgi:hypothetical protein